MPTPPCGVTKIWGWIKSSEPRLKLVTYVLKWVVLACLVAAFAGSASAAFLWSLDWATRTRDAHPLLIWGLPLIGGLVGWVYHQLGRDVEAGNNLLIDEIHDPKKIVPLRMAPLILFGTIASHLFGASVGREGTAVQMGGALADQFTHFFKFNKADRRLILMAGMSAGFASVFGTPLAGAVFALEVLAVGRMRYDALWPCALAALVADQICQLWGIEHTQYSAGNIPHISLWLMASVALAGAAFGLTGQMFAKTTHVLSGWMKNKIAYAPLRPLLGGVVVVLLIEYADFGRYVGLGIPVIQEAFIHPLSIVDSVDKFILTVLSLGSSFKGGEVTPLFFIGATLGNTLSGWLDVPFGLLAAVGFVGVFAGAANTPLACTLMAMELFGTQIGIYALIGCVLSYLFSGRSGIYLSQLKTNLKHV
jgi:H+/Cl- antiporter ClcA